MEQYKMLNNTQTLVAKACEQFVSGELDGEAFRNILSNIPNDFWLDAEAALSMIQILVEDEDLYDMSLQKKVSFPKFISSFLPQTFWKNRDGILRATELIIDDLISWCSFASFSDFTDILQFLPNDIRQDRYFVLSMVEMIAARQSSLDWNGDFEDVVPSSFSRDKDSLLAVVMYIMRANQSNAADFGLVPTAAWEYSEIIFWILSNFQDAYEADRYLFTMYPMFRGSKRDYLESFISFVSNKFKSDKEFVLEFLGYDYFSDEFDILYDWMDNELWCDKQIALRVLETDVTAVVHLPQELSIDEEIKNYIEENIDFDWDLGEVSTEKIPQWIKEWKV
jgi:hypothetical protein